MSKHGDWRKSSTAAFAVATAVREDRVRFTNSPWSFSQEEVRQALGLRALRVVNDFEALALSLPGLMPGQMQGFPGGPRTPLPGLTLGVVGPGTGLGVGAVVPSATGHWDALPGEGGHATLAADDDLDHAAAGARLDGDYAGRRCRSASDGRPRCREGRAEGVRAELPVRRV